MRAVCSREDRHTQRPDRLLSLLLPGQPTHAHKTGYVHKPPHAGAEGPDPRQGKRREGHVPGGESRRQGPGGGRKAANRVACRPDNNKDGKRDFQRRSGCTQRGALAWLHAPARARLVPWGTTAIRERLRVLPRAGLGGWGRRPAAGSGGDAMERAALG